MLLTILIGFSPHMVGIKGFKRPTPNKPLSPMPENYIVKVFDNFNCTVEGFAAHEDLEKNMGFSYCSLARELTYAYVTCCPDIVYSICCLRRFKYMPF